jgi:hypothetical protein
MLVNYFLITRVLFVSRFMASWNSYTFCSGRNRSRDAGGRPCEHLRLSICERPPELTRGSVLCSSGMFALLREGPAEVSSSIRHNVADILSGERAMEHTVAGFGERRAPRQQALCAAR